ncbi:hypothetical protein BGZ95_004443, partial [Linnemannia exigua]
MQAYRIKKFSDSNDDLDYNTLSNFKEGFEQFWGENIVEEHARKAREDAIKMYEEAGRNLQRAREREEAIMYEYEAGLFAVEVGSSASQQIQGHGHQSFSPLVEQQLDAESRSRHSSPTTTAAAAAVSFQIQENSNNEAMLGSRIVPQVSDTPSVFSETPRPQNIDSLTPQPIIGPPAVPVSVPVSAAPEQILNDPDRLQQRLTSEAKAENPVLNQTRSSSQSR